jgi:hypothetical protein
MALPVPRDKQCVVIKYSMDNRYKPAYITCYGTLRPTVWTFLTDQHRKNNGCLIYCPLESVKRQAVELTRSNMAWAQSTNTNSITIKRERTHYNITVLFDNSKCFNL